MARASKILPRLKKIAALQKRQDTTNLHIMMNTYKSNKMLSILENKCDVIIKAIKEVVKKPTSDFRGMVDWAGETTFLKSMNVGTSYYTAFGFVCIFGIDALESHPQSSEIVEHVKCKWKDSARDRHEWCKRLAELSSLERGGCDWP